MCLWRSVSPALIWKFSDMALQHMVMCSNTWWNNLQFIHRTAIYTIWKIYRCIPYMVLEHVAMETEILNHASALSNCKPQECASLNAIYLMSGWKQKPSAWPKVVCTQKCQLMLAYHTRVCEGLRKEWSNHKQRLLHPMKSHQEMSSSPDFAISLVGKRLYIG